MVDDLLGAAPVVADHAVHACALTAHQGQALVLGDGQQVRVSQSDRADHEAVDDRPQRGQDPGLGGRVLLGVGDDRGRSGRGGGTLGSPDGAAEETGR
ncbi:MAG: hypothetical protein WB441_17320 [Nocardioidaceae bacterium]